MEVLVTDGQKILGTIITNISIVTHFTYIVRDSVLTEQGDGRKFYFF